MAIDSVKLEVESTSGGDDGGKDDDKPAATTTAAQGNNNSPATGESTAAVSVAVLSVMSLGVLLAVKSKQLKK